MGTFWKNRPEELLKKLEDRGINQRIVARYELGWAEKHPDLEISKISDSGERLTIPVKKDGKYINIRFHTLSGADNKDLPFKKGLPYATWLFPENQLDNDIIWLCEDKLDALCAAYLTIWPPSACRCLNQELVELGHAEVYPEG